MDLFHTWRLSPLLALLAALLLTGTTSEGASPPRVSPRALLRIPEHLLPCYENQTLYEQTARLPPSMATFLTLVSKLERDAGAANMDMRTFSASLLHRFRLDGIQRDPEVPITPGVVPFTTSGRQRAKFQVVMEQLLPPGSRFPEEALKDYEVCALHFMLSATVQPWQRGDEHEICPLAVGGRNRRPATKPRSWSEWPGAPDEPDQRSAGEVSRCPIEEGSVWTAWGAVGVGPLLAGLAASLQQQSVPLRALMRSVEAPRDAVPVDNVWGATLAGDLAEVTVYQGPRAHDSTYMRMGPGGRWNDSAAPRTFYFDPWSGAQGGWEEEAWDLTEAELRGGIDGLALASRLPEWVRRQASLRLSQLLDMFYSERGVAFDTSVRACRRADLSAQSVLVPTLQEQTLSFAFILCEQTSTVPITPSALARFTKNAVDAYGRYAESVLWRDNEISPCSEDSTAVPRVEVLTVLDGSWTHWEGQRLVSVLERYADVSALGSAIAVMDGWSGLPIVNFTRLSGYSIRTLQNPTSWPIGLNMENTVREARKLLQLRRALDAKRGENIAACSRGTVVLVFANTATNDEGTLQRAKEEMRIARGILPDVTWLFVTGRRREDYEPFVEDPERDIISATDTELWTFMPTVVRRLREVPGRLIPAMCPRLVADSLQGLPVMEWVPVQPKGPQNEDYVTPGETRVYRIPPAMLLGASTVRITIRATHYGDLVVCKSRAQPGVTQVPPPFPRVALDDEEQCESLMANGEMRFVIPEPCSNVVASDCRPIFIWLQVQRTDFKCTEMDCRFPDQVRFSLWHEGLTALPRCASSGYRISPLTPALALALIISLTKRL